MNNKEHFQDIVPPQKAASASATRDMRDDDHIEYDSDIPNEQRSIRNINASSGSRTREAARERSRQFPSSGRRMNSALWWIGGTVLATIIVVAGAASLFVFRPTTVTITPTTQTVVFDQSSQFVAYPAPADASAGATSTAGELTYTVQTFTFTASTTVAAQKGATAGAASKATGTITVVNSYSAAPLKFVKGTRFTTPDGLIFRALSDVIVPGTKKGQPGTVDITVAADQAGSQYNVGPTAKFTLPGLQKSSSYTKVYAKSSVAMTGGTSGADSAAAPGAAEAARTQLQTQLEQQVRAAVTTLATAATVAFPDLAMVSYTDAPSVVDTAGVHIARTVTATVPVFDANIFANAVAQTVSSDATGAQIRILPGKGYSASPIGATSTTMGTDPVAFAMNGTATLVWQVDTDALAKALAGRDSSAFQTIATGFVGVQEAHARIEPPWAHTFPNDPSAIHIQVNYPQQ